MANNDLIVCPANELNISVDKITDFIKREWRRSIALSLPNFYRWQFVDSPFNQGLDRSVLVVNKDNELFGFMGVNEREFYLNGEKLIGAELTTWVITDSARGMGLGRQIIEHIQSAYDVVAGISVTQDALKVYLRYDFKWIRYIPRHIKIISPVSLRKIGNVSPLGESLITRHENSLGVSYTVRECTIEAAQDVVDDFHSTFNCFSMDTSYLRWRYKNHPVYKYRFFKVTHKGSDGIVILRRENTPHCDLIHVIDIIAPQQVVVGIANFVEHFGRDEKVDFMDWFCLSERINHELWCRGWFSVLNDPYIEVPYLYYPLEMRTPATSSAIVWAKYDACKLLYLNDLYLTKGNADFDRPTMTYLNQSS
jgi:hypothetical protein